MTNRENNATAEAPLTWTSKSEWGSVGNTHRASITLANGDQWSFVVDQPRKGQWTARGWRKDREDVAAGRTGSGDMVFYREDRTMKGAKAQVQAHANLAQTSTCDECRKLAGHKLDCGTGRALDAERTKGQKLALRDGDTGRDVFVRDVAQSLPVRQPATAVADARVLHAVDEAAEIFGRVGETVGQLGKAATAAMAAVAPIGRLVRSLIANQPCGCPTPIHRMHCGNGATPRVIRKAGV